MKVLIIGSSGYIGSYLVKKLRNRYDVTGIDIIQKDNKNLVVDYTQIDEYFLYQFNIIIFLAGISTRQKSTELKYEEVYKKNVTEPIQFFKKCKSTQLVLYSSTVAVYENCIDEEANENNKVEYDILDNYSKSMFERDINVEKNLILNEIKCKIVGLRFGTVIGISDNQRTNLVHIAMLKSALTTGIINVYNGTQYRSILWMKDLYRCIDTLINNRNEVKSKLYNIVSYNCTIAKIANEIACMTGSVLKYKNDEKLKGFKASNQLFSSEFNFQFKGNFYNIFNYLNKNINKLLQDEIIQYYPIEKENYENRCRICKSDKLYIVFDFGSQPLANNYIEKKHELETFPLCLLKCSICHHTQLNYTVNSQKMFDNYIYESGTSQTLKNYFRFLAEYIDKFITNANKTIIEIACNDGSQLDEFKKLNWKTIGIDPAKNLTTKAKNNGHIIYNGYWGVDKFDVPVPDIIMAQNVIAHVPDPVKFLQECYDHMNDDTLLVIQTSQCDMYQNGQFDTVYHEHLSFFTAHSFKYLAEKCKLNIVLFKKEQIHGNSFLLFMKKNNNSILHDDTLQEYINYEKYIGINNISFYAQYKYKITNMKNWINDNVLSIPNCKIVGYGAAAKGMTFINYMKDLKIDYIVDDSPLKHNKYCSINNVIVYPNNKLEEKSNMIIFVFAWNFIDEIIEKIKKLRIDTNFDTYVVVIHPIQKIYKLVNHDFCEYDANLIEQIPLNFLEINSKNPKFILYNHFKNEEILMRNWIRTHSPLCHKAILIDYGTTDKTIEIIKEEAPSSWEIVKSTNHYFDAELCDKEVQYYESFHKNDYNLALTCTEFLMSVNPKKTLMNINSNKFILPIRILYMNGEDPCDNPSVPPIDNYTSYIKQRYRFFYDLDKLKCRYMHKGLTNYKYEIGRHKFREYDNDTEFLNISNEIYICKFAYTIFPECLERKLQFKNDIPQSDIDKGFGSQHVESLEKTLEIINFFKNVVLSHFLDEELNTKIIWKNII